VTAKSRILASWGHRPRAPAHPSSDYDQLFVVCSDPFVIFSGGMPRASYGDRHTVTVMCGDSHVVFDLSSPVVDFVVLSAADEREASDVMGMSVTVPLSASMHRLWGAAERQPTVYNGGVGAKPQRVTGADPLFKVGPRGSVVKRQSLASVLSPSCARPVADG